MKLAMKLDGSLGCSAPLKLARALADPEVLAKVAPAGCVIGAKVGDTIPFKIGRRFGPVHITLSCTLTLQTKADAPGFDLVIQGAHLIGGKVTIRLDLTPQLPPAGPRRLFWSGTMQASGLAGRLAEAQDAHGQAMVKQLMQRLKLAIEDQPVLNAATPASLD